MAKALMVRINTIMCEMSEEELRAEILRQYHNGGVIVLDNSIKYEVVEFDTVQVNSGRPVALGKSELFGELNGQSVYVVRDEYGRIVVSDELMTMLIERLGGSVREG